MTELDYIQEAINELQRLYDVYDKQTKTGVAGVAIGYDSCITKMGALKKGIDALREKAERQNPRPLTLEELNERNSPVWVPLANDTGYWVLCKNGTIIPPSGFCLPAKGRMSWGFLNSKPEGATDG